jgi:hypothetical protein
MWFALVALLIVPIAAVLVAWLGRAPAPCLPHVYDRPPRPGTFAARTIERLPPVVRDPPAIEAQSAEWRAAMAAIGRRLRRAGVRRVIFVHGTFVGHDPTTIFGAIGRLLGPLNPPLVLGLKQLTKTPSDRVLGDLGNYTPDYVALFAAATGVAAERYVWCSANHHFARLRGAARLLGLLADIRRARVLLIGHSHAAQLFALFTQLVYPARTGPALWAVLRDAGEPVDRLAAAAGSAARARIDIATFGGPPRYSWAPSSRCRVIHVINHRGVEPRAGVLGGVFHTEGGDYVQQLGIAGSDVPPGSAKERELTARLDSILGAGCDPRAWREHLRHRARVPEHGFTWLVDYGDRATSVLPNCLATLFGHGVYTTYEAMLFNAQLLADHFYR